MGGLRQLHLSAAWTSHNTPAFDFAAAHSELTAAGFSTGIEGGAAQGLGQGANPPVSRHESQTLSLLYVS